VLLKNSSDFYLYFLTLPLLAYACYLYIKRSDETVGWALYIRCALSIEKYGTVQKYKEVESGCSLAQSSKERCDSQRAVLPMVLRRASGSQSFPFKQPFWNETERRRTKKTYGSICEQLPEADGYGAVTENLCFPQPQAIIPRSKSTSNKTDSLLRECALSVRINPKRRRCYDSSKRVKRGPVTGCGGL
jgi:hypothetical protein